MMGRYSQHRDNHRHMFDKDYFSGRHRENHERREFKSIYSKSGTWKVKRRDKCRSPEDKRGPKKKYEKCRNARENRGEGVRFSLKGQGPPNYKPENRSALEKSISFRKDKENRSSHRDEAMNKSGISVERGHPCGASEITNMCREIMDSIISSVTKEKSANLSCKGTKRKRDLGDGPLLKKANKALESQGIKEGVLYEKDSLAKMKAVFASRIHFVAEKEFLKSGILADKMIDICQATFGSYAKMRELYLEAKKAEISRLKVNEIEDVRAWLKDCNDNELARCPSMIDFRVELHKQLSDNCHKERKTLKFRFSEVVDLIMYFFNHVSDEAWIRKLV